MILIAGAVFAALRNRGRDARGPSGAVLAIAIAYVASQLLQRALERQGFAAVLGTPLGTLELAGWTLASLVLVGAVARLGLHGPLRRRDLVWAIGGGVSAVALLVAKAPPVLPALMALAAVSRMRWRDRASVRTLALAALIGIAAPAWNVFTRALPITRLPGPWPPIVALAEWSRILIGLYFLIGLPGTLMRIGVGIRSVSRRLTLAHLLTGVVPLLLVGALWFVSTYLGVGAERALTAARVIQEEGAHLETDLARVGHAPAPRTALADWAAAQGARWPGLRVWIAAEAPRPSGRPAVDPGAGGRAAPPARAPRPLERVRGAAVPAESLLASWPDTAARHAIVSLADSIYLGAQSSDLDSPGGGRTRLIALVPASDLLAAGVQRVAGARVWIEAKTVITTRGGGVMVDVGEGAGPRLGASYTSPAELRRLQDSLAALQESRAEPAAPGSELAGRRVDQVREAAEAARESRPFDGHAMLAGLQATPEGWKANNFLLNARVPLAETLAGLARNRRENPFNFFVIAVLGMLGLVFLGVAVFNVGMVSGMSRSITRAISALRTGAERLQSGDLAHRIPVEGRDDLWSVAEAFNQMAVGLERSRELEKERERLESELALARQIQSRLLPSGPPRIAGLDIAGTSESARQVGGDYYDHVPLGDGRVLLVIADVSGKGVPAALIMSGFRAALMSQDAGRESVAELAERINHFLNRSVETGRFVTAFLGVLDGRSGRLAYTNAGHNPPLVVRRGGAVERLEAGGLLFGMLPDAAYECGETRLDPGDRVVLYTDGVTEAANVAGEMWEEERLIACLRRRVDATSVALVAAIVDEVRCFEGDQGPSDDITLLVARRDG